VSWVPGRALSFSSDTLAGMDQDPLLTMNLGQAWPEIVYTANCLHCHEIRRVDLKAMAERLGQDFPLLKLRERLKCQKCERKRITIATRWKSSGTSVDVLQRWPFDYD
jgi:hypothetical protein